MRTNRTRSATPAAIVDTAAADPHPQSGAWMTPRMRTAMAADDTANPGQSTGGVRRSREVGTARGPRGPTTAGAAAMKVEMPPPHDPPRNPATPAGAGALATP